MSGLGPSDMGEVERTAVLFVQRRDAGPPGGSGPGSPDKNITCVCVRLLHSGTDCVFVFAQMRNSISMELVLTVSDNLENEMPFLNL